jgi:hypothetical protein
VITGADERTNLSIFTVGRATAVDPTGAFNLLQPISSANNPANNGSPLFVGHASTTYDGVADVSFVAISSASGKFGGVRTANANYLASQGFAGICAPGVQFMGPVYVGDINASDAASPMLLLGAATDVQINGGDLWQPNGRSVQVSGVAQLKFVNGTTSHGASLSAQIDRSRLEQEGIDVTAKVVVNPAP